MNDFDFIIVGGGSAGCALAGRLSADPSLRVLVLESGGAGKHPYSRVPAALNWAQHHAGLNWMYETQPDASRDGRVDFWPAGRGLGGGSSINGMMWVRGHAHDYDQWARMGAEGWDYRSVLPYFRRAETNERGANEFRGGSGPQRVSEVRIPHRLTDAWVAAAGAVGIPISEDLNGASAEGAGYCQVSQRQGWRHSAAFAYLGPARHRKNLVVWTHSTVEKVIIEDGVATGVRVSRGGVQHTLKARGVALCAGAIASPKLLMLSGIGPAHHLRQVGIEVLADRPGVGMNLQEHPGTMMNFHVNIDSLGSDRGLFRDIVHGLTFLFQGRGPLSTPVGHAQAFIRTRAGLDVPNVQLIMSPFAFDVDERGARLCAEPTVGVAIGLARPESRGSISLRSANPEDRPQIAYSLLGAQNEVDQLREGCEMLRRIVVTPPFAQYLVGERFPGARVESEADWDAYIRQSAFPMYHPSGTCRMGMDPMAVVNSRLRVHDIGQLWVADASIMPTLPAGNINASCVMIGEKAGDLIAQDLR